METTKPTKLPFPTTYTPEQEAAIREALLGIKPGHDRRTGCDYDREGVLFQRRSGQLFGVFGQMAFELLCMRLEEEGTVYEYLPVIHNGHVIGEFPDEGRCGVLHLIRCLKRKGIEQPGRWSATFMSGGYLDTEELNMKACEIAERIAEEVDAGLTPLTGGKPGWD
jgi:hypothetical protein